ncbi:MAG: hypothetical protein GY708_28285 [Actinomycetia bacterium]|nr:hypothetical protein [Actinomycetes bacterium]
MAVALSAMERVVQDPQVASAWTVAHALTEVFDERPYVAEVNRHLWASRQPGVVYPFVERCAASGVPHVAESTATSILFADSAAVVELGGPRKRLRIAATRECRTGPVNAVRSLGDLVEESGRRSMCLAVGHSWKSTRSGLRAWASFVDEFFPGTSHFPVAPSHVAAFSSLFRNADTLSQYLSHLRFGTRLLMLDTSAFDAVAKQAVRGRKGLAPRREKCRFRGSVVRALVGLAFDEDDRSAARLYVIARSYMLRVASEGFGLQLDGRHGRSRGDRRWHSQISIDGDVVAVILRVRKNERSGAVIKRSCSCRLDPVLCGACLLRTMVAEHREARRHPSVPFFEGLEPSRSLRHLKRRAHAAGVVSDVGWHGFRRGTATDVLAGGSDLAKVLCAGGWKSSAFLRYLVMSDVDHRAACEMIADGSDSEVEI